MADAAKRALTEGGDHIWSRRHFAALVGWGATLTALGISTLGFLRFMYPRVLFEPPSSFKAGYPTDYTIGAVSERFKSTKRVWIVRTPEGFFALIAICTHLGCTPRWLSGEDKFKCPCHGSGFTRMGVNFEGPAPRPLERCKIVLGDDGQLIVDKSVIFLWEKDEWGNEGSFLEFKV